MRAPIALDSKLGRSGRDDFRDRLAYPVTVTVTSSAEQESPPNRRHPMYAVVARVIPTGAQTTRHIYDTWREARLEAAFLNLTVRELELDDLVEYFPEFEEVAP